MIAELFRHTGPERPSTAANWLAAVDEARALLRYAPNWDGDDAAAVRPELVRTAINFFRQLKHLGVAAPDAVYPLAGGTVMCEWHYSDRTTVSVEFRAPGKAEVLDWHPSRAPVFCIVLVVDGRENRVGWRLLGKYLTDPARTVQQAAPVGNHESAECDKASWEPTPQLVWIRDTGMTAKNVPSDGESLALAT